MQRREGEEERGVECERGAETQVGGGGGGVWGGKGGGWRSFDGTDFCRVLKEGRKVLLVGDSLNLQFAKSLLYNTIMNSSGEVMGGSLDSDKEKPFKKP